MLLTVTTLLSAAHAGPLNAWGAAQSAHTAAAVATAYSDLDGSVAPTLYGGLGLANGDVWTGLGLVGDLGTGDAAYTLDLMPRWFPTPSIGISPRILYTQGDSATTVGLEVHHVAGGSRFALTSNLAWHPTVSAAGFDPGDVVALVGPELFFTERVSFAAEIDVSTPVAAPDQTAAALAPSLSAIFGREGAHSAALGAIVPVYPQTGAPTMGGWYSFVFDTSRPAIAADDE